MKKFTHRWQPKSCLLLMLLAFGGVSAPLQAAVENKTSAIKPVVWEITGRVTSPAGEPLPGVTVLLKGTTNGTATDVSGRYSLNVPENAGTLVFSFIGYTTTERTFSGPGAVNVSLADDARALEEVVVTGYTSEKKRDIIGSVSVVKPAELLQTPAANLQAQLQGRASGVTVSGNGQPGAGAKVRIRGFASFGNNDPLYVIDGVPTENPSSLNPQDIESLQVLKDATSASIYGSRAANGVIIVTTKRGKAGTSSISVDSYTGVQIIPGSSMPKMLNTAQYGEYLFTAARNGGVPFGIPDSKGVIRGSRIYGNGVNPVVPAFIVVSPGFSGGVAANDPRANPSLYNISGPASSFYQIIKVPEGGTNWFEEITRPAVIQSHQITASGGTEKGTYSLGVNYFNQEGTIVHTGYDRATVRANTMFNPVKRIRVGENMQITYEQRQGGGESGEGGAWAQAYRMVPYLSVYDINEGFSGNRVGESGNGSSPIANLTRNKDNKNNGFKIFGNVFAELDILNGLTARTSFGTDYSNGYNNFFNSITYERSENQTQNAFNENFGYFNTWTWSNTLNYTKTISENHGIKLLVGTEAVKGSGRGLSAGNTTYDLGNNIDFRTIQAGTGIRTASTFNTGRSSLYSLFSRIDYSFRDKYLFNATVRRDASSKFGPESRVGIFPAVGVAWRISDEGFMQGLPLFSELKLRGGWGQMGSQRNVDANNQFSTFISGPRESWYPINGQNNASAVGYRQGRLGNLTTQWETTETTNLGLDATLLDGRFTVTVEGYNIVTKDLLIDAPRNGLSAEIQQPRINIGQMRNRGIDINLGTTGNFAGDFTYDASVNFTSFTNELTKLAEPGQILYRGASRTGNIIAIKEGYPISSFFGYKIDGIFQNQAELDAIEMPYETIGSWRFKDLNGDKKIDDKDRDIIGNPIPKFQIGSNLSLAYKNFDISTFLFWNYGNDLYNYTKYFTDLRGFVGGVSTRVLENSWSETNRDATLPIISSRDTYSSSVSSSYYIEKGSYLRMRTLQLGYKVPANFSSKARLNNVRLYIQGQNLFTVTKYQGADPDISIVGNNNDTGDDQFMGVDQANYPNARQFIFGINLGF